MRAYSIGDVARGKMRVVLFGHSGVGMAELFCDDAHGGAVPLPDGRTVTVGRAEHDSLWGERRKRAWVVIRKQASMPARR